LSALVPAALLALGAWGCATQPAGRPPDVSPEPVTAPATTPPVASDRLSYPEAEASDFVEALHGSSIADPYRWLEKADDPRTGAFVEAQNSLTRSVLERPERPAIHRRITDLYDYPKMGLPKKAGKKYFYTKNTGLQNQSVYFVQEGLSGAARVLLDPNALSPDGTVAVTNFSPTEDGSLVGYAISRSGSDRQEISVRDVATGRDLPDQILWVKFSGISWTPDNKGFFYTRYPETGTVPAGDEHYFPKIYYHRLGDAQERDRMVFEKPAEKEVGIGATVSDDGRWLILQPAKGASDKAEIHVLDLRREGARPVLVTKGFRHAYAAIEVIGDRLYATTDRDAPMGRVVSVDLRRIPRDAAGDARFTEVVPAGKDKLQAASVINRRLVLRYLRNASTTVAIHDLSGRRESEVSLPGVGTVGAVSGEPDEQEMFLSYVSFVDAPATYRYDFDARKLIVFHRSEVKLDSSGYETQQVWYPSKDGTKVSMFLTHRKGVARDGNRPVYLYAYGGFNISQTPSFSATRYVFLERGGVIAIPNLRGGGEYGEDWHAAGMREKKQNVFDDFIAAAEWLVANGYTKPGRLAIGGGSNGGLLVSAVMLQRPDLYGAVICQVPVADMLRYHKFTVGRYWIAEYGDPDVPEDFSFLVKYSPYHNVREGVAYPATLITTADSDDRVDPGHGKKLAARLQRATSGDEPILLRVETKAGHGAGKPTSKQIDEAADVYTFLFWRLGMLDEK